MKIKKPAKKLPYADALEKVLKAIDAAPVAKDQPIFKKLDDKEYYETLLMFSYRKQQAAQHHFDNVDAMLKNANDDALANATSAAKAKQPKAVTSSSMTWSAEAYIHELSAFLAALRTGLDFLAMAAGKTMKGVTAHSMHTLEGMADKGGTGLVLDVVKTNSAWLEELRDYRDEVVHRQVVRAPAAGWVVSTKGKMSTAVLPIVVPRTTPKRVLDTRRSRMMESDAPVGLNRTETYADVTDAHGNKKVLEHSVSYVPTTTHMPITLFMSYHAKEYREFSIGLFEALEKSEFGKIK